MKNYKLDRLMIYNYITGNLDGNIKKVLENDPKFMMKVISITQDKKYYDYASIDVKNDYYFIKNILDIFSNDIEFLEDVISLFASTRNSINVYLIDIYIQFSNILIKNNTNRKYNFEISYYREQIAVFYGCIKEFIFESEEKMLGKGFGYILYTFDECEDVIKYFANHFLSEIFFKNQDYTFSDIVHKNFKKYDDLKKYGIKKFILDYIAREDIILADYLLANIDLIKSIEEQMISLEKNWQMYITRVNLRKRKAIIDLIKNIEKETGVNCSNTFSKVLNQMNIENDFLINKDNESDNIIYLEEIKLKNDITKYLKQLYSSNILEKIDFPIPKNKNKRL
ncbi:MAG: hypothetical protein IJ574_01305 [Bacilli bacterium]|nr:hypothetical protein [Bacilli bacterium]